MNDNVLAILEEASASYQDIYEITYINKCMQKKVFHIFDVEFSDKQGEHTSRCIKAYTLEFRYEEKTTFSCSNIISINKYWKSIVDKDETAPEDGLYVFTCRGDNHLEEEIYYLNKGDRLYKYFECENSHMNGWFEVMPLAFHYIEPYNHEHKCSKWLELNCIKEHEDSLFIAVTKPNSSIVKNNYCPEIILNGYCYFVFYNMYHVLEDFNTNEIYGVYPIAKYTENNHILFWNKWRELHSE